MTTIQFFTSDELKSTLRAAGATAPLVADVDSCPFLVDDVIAYPAPIALALRVSQRVFYPAAAGKPGHWYVRVEPVEHPIGV